MVCASDPGLGGLGVGRIFEPSGTVVSLSKTFTPIVLVNNQ